MVSIRFFFFKYKNSIIIDTTEEQQKKTANRFEIWINNLHTKMNNFKQLIAEESIWKQMKIEWDYKLML